MKDVASPLDGFHPSNALTYFSLALGVTALASALHGNVARAGALVALAALADTFDGRFARAFGRTPTLREFGAQLDSLVDIIVFVAVPIVCGAIAAMKSEGSEGPFWWAAAFVYALCGSTRLAFFNLSHDADGFVGLPAPAAALIWSSTILAWADPRAIAGVFSLTGTLMVAPIRIRRPARAGLVAFALWPVALVVAYVVAR
jgi:phosphatidylserine synthase